jgi:hypothetical protein
MSEPVEQIPQLSHNPGDDYPPTRPGPVLIAIVLAVFVAGLSIASLPDLISAAKALGL